MALEEYKKRRNFSKTPEPKAEVRLTGKRVFVVQEHWTSRGKTSRSNKERALDRVHWDLRLEKDGVLKSWAVPKGLPIELGVKRLAIPTEDHPVEYANFEGGIAEGQYGAGTVKIWDKGTFEEKTWEAGKIEVIFKGEKLKGPYVMVKTRMGWLVFKKE